MTILREHYEHIGVRTTWKGRGTKLYRINEHKFGTPNLRKPLYIHILDMVKQYNLGCVVEVDDDTYDPFA
jgi:hypothetical protein